MKCTEEENIARDLHKALTIRCATLIPDATISVEGRGVHWDCGARKDVRSCSIGCFATRGKPGYFLSFEHDTQGQAWGRTFEAEEVLSAVGSWLQGQELELLYDQFEFIDRQKRSLAAMRKQMLEYCPELAQCATQDLHQIICDLYELWFRAKDRSCRLSYYGENVHPNAIFHWDECNLFVVQTDQFGQLALVLKRWLCDYTRPSDLEKEFPWVDVGQLARYYEEGRGIEGEFLLSWDRLEQFYGERINRPFCSAVLEMIAQMRKRGYDKTLRAGQSLYSLIVSRARRHGLREDQPSITFHFGDNNMDVCTNLAGGMKLSLPKIEFTAQIDDLLKQLEARNID